MQALYRSFTLLERRLFTGLSVVAIVAFTGMVDTQNGFQIIRVPTAGGVYREGVLTTSSRDVESMTTALTKVGLVRIDSLGRIEPALAESWEISEDKQSVKVRLTDKITAETVLGILKAQNEPGYWKEAEMTVVEPQVLEFRVSRPWASFISELTAPIFSFGPYEKVETEKETTGVLSFVANSKALTQPYLEKIELHLAQDTKSLERAIRKNTIDAAFVAPPVALSQPGNWEEQVLHLRHEYVLFFNLRQPTLEDTKRRQAILKNEALPEPVTLRLAVADTPDMRSLAAELKTAWAPLNINLEIETYPTLTLTKKVIPERDYDLILLGIDYGPEGDLYPYWHSSQIAAPGQNLSGYRNKEIDRLLDEAHQHTDAAERQVRYKTVRAMIADQAVALTLGSPEALFVRSGRIKGEIPDVLHSLTHRWTEMTNWYSKEKPVTRESEK